MLDLILDLKVCLALALVLGMLTGYLYNMFALKEEFTPTIIKLKNNINAQNDEMHHLGEKYIKTQQNIESYKQKISSGKKSIAQMEKDIDFKHTTINALQEKVNTTSKKLQTLQEELDEKSNHIGSLQSEIGSDTIQSLEKTHTENKKIIEDIENKIASENNILFETQQRYHNLQKQRDTLIQERRDAQDTLRDIQERLAYAKDEESTLETTLQENLKDLKSTQYALLEKIKTYRMQLLKLKS